jgi:hypothetical protein
MRELVRLDVDFVILDENDPRLDTVPAVVLPPDRRPPQQYTGRVLQAEPQALDETLRLAGISSAVRAIDGSLWTAAYDAAGVRHGFCVNIHADCRRSVLEGRAAPSAEVEWLVPPTEWDGEGKVITLGPRTVAVWKQ